MEKKKKRIITKRAKKEALAAYLFILPFMAGVAVFNIYAFLRNVAISFTNKRSFGNAEFIGWKNYVELFESQDFYQVLLNTLKYIVICVPAILILSLLIALALNVKIRGIGVYRTLIYLPAVTLPTAIGLVWKWMFNNQFGLINAMLGKLGIQGKAWLSDPKVSLYSICIVSIWCGLGTPIIIFLAGLQGIERTYYEAAEIDGANSIQKFLNITFPLLTPTTFMLMVTQIIGFFQVFDMIFLMIATNSSGMSGARSIVMFFYEEAFTKFYRGYGAAIANVLFVIILIITMIQMKLQKKWVYYE